MTTTAYTVGHSTRTLDELVDMLKAHGVAGIADVRRFAGSRKLPHFNAEHLVRALPDAEWRTFRARCSVAGELGVLLLLHVLPVTIRQPIGKIKPDGVEDGLKSKYSATSLGNEMTYMRA